MPFVKGDPNINRAGRPKGIPDRRTALQRALTEAAPAVQAKMIELAVEGDVSAATLVMNRAVPTLRPRSEATPFELDTSAPVPAQMEQVVQAVAAGDLTIDEGKQIGDLLRQLAEVRALDKAGDNASQIIDALNQFARSNFTTQSLPDDTPGNPPE